MARELKKNATFDGKIYYRGEGYSKTHKAIKERAKTQRTIKNRYAVIDKNSKGWFMWLKPKPTKAKAKSKPKSKPKKGTHVVRKNRTFGSKQYYKYDSSYKSLANAKRIAKEFREMHRVKARVDSNSGLHHVYWYIPSSGTVKRNEIINVKIKD